MISKLTSVALLVATAAAQAGLFFVQDTGAALVIDRVDPVLLPGVVPGNHVHSIVGPNTFHANVTYDELQQANCSTAFIKQDKSVYWMPSLYFQDPKNGTLRRVPERPEHKIYYLNRIGKNETMNGFPRDFRMIGGQSNLRSKPTTKLGLGITEWNCHDPNLSDAGFPQGMSGCGYGFAGSIHFPHCWNGEAFDINNPTAHMSYPMGDHPDGGYCPDSHPKAMPHIFIEFWFNTKPFDGLYGPNDNPWVLSHGDPTGYGFHADFINGWEEGVLQKAMTTCTIGESGRPLSECFDVYTPDERNACSIQPQVQDDYDAWVPSLPGCNPIQSGPANAAETPACDASGKVVAGVSGVVQATSAPTIPSVPVGGAAATSAAAATSIAGSKVSAAAANIDSPVAAATAAPVAPQVFRPGVLLAKPAPKASSPAKHAHKSICGAETNNNKAGAETDNNEAGAETDNNEAGAETDNSNAGAETDNNKAVASPEIITRPDPADASLPSFTLPNANVRLAADWSSAGCYSDAIHPVRSLSGIRFANLGGNFSTTGMTSSGCVAYCVKRGYSIAGTEFGSQCFCGNQLVNSKKIDEGACSMPCKGDRDEMCGGSRALSVFHSGAVDLSGVSQGTTGVGSDSPVSDPAPSRNSSSAVSVPLPKGSEGQGGTTPSTGTVPGARNGTAPARGERPGGRNSTAPARGERSGARNSTAPARGERPGGRNSTASARGGTSGVRNGTLARSGRINRFRYLI